MDTEPDNAAILVPGPSMLVRTGIALVVATGVAAVLNAFAFARHAAIPLVQSDAWRFLDGWLGEFLRGEMSWTHMLYQPTSTDTNMPLQKLVVMMHATWLDLDFSIESTIGCIAALVFCAVVIGSVWRRRPTDSALPEALFATTLVLGVMTLNSTNLYTWGLASLWFVPMLVVAIFGSWLLARARPWWGVALAATIVGILLDEVGIVVVGAASSVLVLRLRQEGPRPTARTIVAMVGGLVLALVIYASIDGNATSPVEAADASLSVSPAAIWWAIVVPISDAILHPVHHEALFGAAAARGALALKLVALALTVWFWVLQLRLAWRRELGRGDSMAAFLMLVSYGMVGGILLHRVGVFGPEYLHQPRYVLFYLLQLVALLVLAYSRFGRTRRYVPAAAVLLLAMAALQWFVSARAWIDQKYVDVYIQQAAFTLGRIANDPAFPGPCADILTICSFPPERRAKLLGLLRDRELNLYSPDFRARHRLYMYPEQMPTAN